MQERCADEQTSQSVGQYVRWVLKSTALASFSMACAAATAPAHAQSATDATQTESSDSAPVVETIVVRGQARRYRPDEQTSATGLNLKLIDTPQSITVLTPEMLDTIGALSAYDATDLIPGVQKSGFGFGNQQIVLRGVFLENQRINGILSSNVSVAPHAFLSERIEIVRGPATVLYGVTGAFGGEINNVLKRPDKRPEGVFRSKVAVESELRFDTQNYKFDLTGPLFGERLRGRVVFVYDDIGLPYKVTNEDMRHEEINAMASLEWDIAAATTATLWYVRQDRDMDPVDGGALVQLPNGKLALPQEAFPDRVDPETWYFSHPDQSTEHLDMDLVIAELAHTFPNELNAKVQANYSRFDLESSQFFPFGPFGAYGLADDQAYIYTYDRTRAAEELTFNTSLGGNFPLFGREHSFFAAFEYIDSLSPFRRTILDSASTGVGAIDMFADGVYDGVQPRFADGTPFVPVDRAASGIGLRTISEEDRTDYKGSFQLLLRPLDRLEVLAGVLYHRNETLLTRPFNGGAPLNPPERTPSDFTEVVQRWGITYDVLDEGGVIDDARVYVSYSEGFNPQVITDSAGQARVLPQEMEFWEVGVKGEFFDGAVSASLAYYDSKITNLTSFSTTIGSFDTINTVFGGTKDTEGVELEVVGEVLPGWNLAFNYAYTDNVISDPQNFNFTIGERTVPDHSAALLTSYEFLTGPLDGLRLGVTFKASSDYHYVNSLRLANRFRAADGSPGILKDGAYERLDLNVSYEGFSGSFEGLRLYAVFHNVLDEEILVSKQNHPGFAQMFIDQKMFRLGASYSF